MSQAEVDALTKRFKKALVGGYRRRTDASFGYPGDEKPADATNVKTRGRHDIVIAVTDGLEGRSEALAARIERATAA